jgi:hypothetical protein
VYVELVNCVLCRSSAESEAFWNDHLLPAARRLFRYQPDVAARDACLEHTSKTMLFMFLQHHLGLECASDGYDWKSDRAFQRSHLLAIRPRVKWHANKDSPAGRILSSIELLFRSELYAKAVKALDFKVWRIVASTSSSAELLAATI